VNDVTAEEVRAEMQRAKELLLYLSLDIIEPDCTIIATAIAVRAREARREALKEARTAVDGEQLHEIVDNECDRGYRNGIEDASGAILALMGPET
jgi:hypothetical protein